MVKSTLLLAAACLCAASAFTASPLTTTALLSSTTRLQKAFQSSEFPIPEVDTYGNNIAVKKFLQTAESRGLLSQVAQSGLLSKAQAAGLSLSKLEPFLVLAAKNPDILVLVEAGGPEVLPLLPQLVDVAPSALPLLAAAVSIPPFLLTAAGLGAIGSAVAAILYIPDNSIANIALQTFIVALSLPAATAAFVGASVLGQLTKKTVKK